MLDGGIVWYLPDRPECSIPGYSKALISVYDNDSCTGIVFCDKRWIGVGCGFVLLSSAGGMKLIT